MINSNDAFYYNHNKTHQAKCGSSPRIIDNISTMTVTY